MGGLSRPGVEEHDEGWKEGDHAEEADEDAAAGDEAELSEALEIDKEGHVEGRRRRDAAYDDRQSGRLDGPADGVFNRALSFELFLVAGREMDPEVDAQPDEHGGEDDGEQGEVADGQGRQGEGQEDGHREGQEAEERPSKAAKEDDEEGEHTHERRQGRPLHVLVGGHHLISLQDRPPCQAELNPGVGAAHLGELSADLEEGLPDELESAGVLLRQDLDEEKLSILRGQVAALAQRASLFLFKQAGQAGGLASFQGVERSL